MDGIQTLTLYYPYYPDNMDNIKNKSIIKAKN